MDEKAVDYAAIFESLPDALAICDEEGRIVSMNLQGRRFLGTDDPGGVRLDLRARETVRQIRLTADVNSHEFYLADVAVSGARRTRVSASLQPIAPSGYRVTFSGDGEASALNPNLRMMEALVNVGRHLDLFRTLDKTLALFETCFADVFPSYGFRVVLDGRALADHVGWDDATTKAPVLKVDLRKSDVAAEELVFAESRRGYRLAIPGAQGPRGFVQFERREQEKFGVSERQAFETFTQQLSLALARLAGEPAIQAVGPIIDQIDAIVVVCDARRRILVSNRTFEALVGAKDVVGRDILDFFEPPGDARIRTTASAILAGHHAEAFDARLLHPGSESVALRVQIAATRGRDGDAASGFIVTGQQSELSLVELEERMARAEQLMNVGQLATGVAHELKNPLTSILNYAEYLLTKYQDTLFEDRDSERLRRIIEGVERIDTFVKDLVVLARPSETDTQRVDLHSIVRESGLMCEVALRQNNTRFQVDLADETPVVNGSPHQLKQVFVNLIANAAKSMGERGGTILVATNVEGQNVVCRVSDDAAGMSEDTMERIFEPFFTTRHGTGGSGLGLALVRTIIRRHGGEIEVESKLGQGTTFTIRLPLAGD